MNIIEFNNNNFGNIRTIVRDDEIWFIAKDIADILGYSETSILLRRLDEDEKDKIAPTVLVDANPMIRELTIINESGLYNAIIGSKKDKARQFKKWITSEVLPSIRKNGYYSIQPKTLGKQWEDTVIMFEASKRFAELCNLKGNQALLSANKIVKKKTNIDLLKEFEIELISNHKSKLFTPTEIGKEIGLSNRKVNILLYELGYQEKIGKEWIATELGKDYVELLDTGKKHSDGTPIKQMKWKYEIIEILKENR